MQIYHCRSKSYNPQATARSSARAKPGARVSNSEMPTLK